MTEQATHENLARDEKLVAGSERKFGVVMAAALAALGGLNWWHDGHVWPWLFGIAALFAVAGLIWPGVLRPLNWLWFRFGLLLHSVVNPVIMGIVFYTAVLPTGLVIRAMGKDPLRLKFEPDRDTYWIAREPPGPAPETMKDQF